MMYTIAAILLATLVGASLSSAAQAPPIRLGDDDDASTPVRIGVTCAGADLSKIDMFDGLYMRRILEETYNSGVEADDSDDSAITVDSFTGGQATVYDSLKNAGTYKSGFFCSC
jgi:hypothetical protein